MCQVAASLLPDLDAGAVVVRAPVGFVAVLIGVKIFVAIGGEKFARFQNCAVAAAITWRQDQLRAVGLEDSLPFWRGVFRQAESHRITARRCNHRVGDASVATGSV